MQKAKSLAPWKWNKSIDKYPEKDSNYSGFLARLLAQNIRKSTIAVVIPLTSPTIALAMMYCNDVAIIFSPCFKEMLQFSIQ